MAKAVRDVMAENPQSVEASDTVADAAKKLKESDIGALLVTDGDELKGIVTDRDIVVGAVAEGKDPDDAKVEDVASTGDVTTVEPDSSLDDAVKQMRDADVRRLPVVEDGKPVGIVSLGDLAIALDDDSALADISASSPNN
jgi:CBS domain-containing protein